MMVFRRLKQFIENAAVTVISIPDVLEEKGLRKKYPDYHGKTKYDCGECKFIWGIKSENDYSDDEAPSFETKNDI